MKKQAIFGILYQLASPIALILVGLILLFSPDTASALISRFLGWAVTLAGIFTGISAIFDRCNAVRKGILSVGCVCIGGWLTAHPLLLAAFVGRLLGILIALRGIRDVFRSRRYGHGQILAVVTAVVGIVLAVLPMTTSRVVFSLCGVVVLVIGIAMLIDRLKDRRYLEDGGDSNIIDAL